MKIKIKKLHENAVIPAYAKPGDAGMDLTAVSISIDENGNTVYGTGLAFEIPIGFVGLLFPRSSNSKTDLRLTNSVGVLDSGYRGEVMFKFRNTNHNVLNKYSREVISKFNDKHINEYKINDRIGQIIIIPIPAIEFVESDELSKTERGAGGYGSTGK